MGSRKASRFAAQLSEERCLPSSDQSALADLKWNRRFNWPFAEWQIQGRKGALMLKWAIIFFLISLVAGALGFTGVARGAAGLPRFSSSCFWFSPSFSSFFFSPVLPR
jgi:hypothetical protein